MVSNDKYIATLSNETRIEISKSFLLFTSCWFQFSKKWIEKLRNFYLQPAGCCSLVSMQAFEKTQNWKIYTFLGFPPKIYFYLDYFPYLFLIIRFQITGSRLKQSQFSLQEGSNWDTFLLFISFEHDIIIAYNFRRIKFKVISNEQVGALSRYNHLYVQKAFWVLFGSIEMK